MKTHSACLCCGKPLGGHGTVPRPDGYCDAICYAADRTLSRAAVQIWKGLCWRLDVNPTRPIS